MTKLPTTIGHLPYHLLIAAAALSLMGSAAARPWRPDQIPNGNVFSCTTCHNTDGSRNPFGLAVQALVIPGSKEPFWGPELAALDSDGDGFTNGQELGDLDGDGTPTAGVQVTRPGNRSSQPNPLTIAHVCATRLALQLTWNDGFPPFLVQQRKTATGAGWTDVVTTDARTVAVPRPSDSAFFRVQSHTGTTVRPFTAWMTGRAAKPEPVSTPGTGFGTLALAGQILTLRVAFSGLSTNASAAYIEGPAETADADDFLIPLTGVPNDSSGVIEGRIDVSSLTAHQVAAFEQSRTYINIQTPNHPDGEIRGRVAPLQLQSSLSSPAEQPDSIMTKGTGSGQFWLIGNEITYEVNYANLSTTATAGDLHGPAAPGQPAGTLIALTPTAGVLSGSGAFSGAATLTPEELGYLLDGLIYVDVHTSNRPAGEIRGQVIP